MATAQPSLSQQIRQLEREIGADLFDRGKRQIALTAAGAEFLVEARALIAQLDTAVAHAREAGRGMRGELRIAYTVSAMMGTLPSALRAYRRAHPHVRVTLRALAPIDVLAAIEGREADAGVLIAQSGSPGATDLETRSFGRLPIAALMPRGHRLARRRTIAIGEIGTETLILFSRHLTGLYDAILAFCHQHGFVPARIEEVERIETILGLVAAGEGLSVVPRLYEKLGYPGVAYTGLRPQPAPFALIVAWRSQTRSPLTAAFVETCEQFRLDDYESRS